MSHAKVTERQKRRVECPSCGRAIGLPCRSSRIPGPNTFGGGWGGPPDLDRAHPARRAAYLASRPAPRGQAMFATRLVRGLLGILALAAVRP